MNKFKPWFAIVYWYLALAIIALSLYRLVTDGVSATWLGAMVATVPFVAFYLWLGSARSAPRSSRRLPVLTLITLAGLGLSVYGYVLQDAGGIAGVLAALLASIGFFLWVNWYSIFDRPLNAQLARGATLPLFEATDRNGKPVATQQLLGHPSLLLFYRGNWCPICMAQVKEVAGRYRDLIRRGVQVVLISPQPHDLTERVADLYDVPFQFWVDEDAGAARALGILHEQGVPIGARGTYGKDTVLPTIIIMDADGKILYTDQASNFRIRPDPDSLVEVLATHGY